MSSFPGPVAVFARRRTWGELGYAVLGLPQGVAFFAFTMVTLSLSAGLAVTFIGLPLLAVTGLMSRWLGSAARRVGNGLLGESLPGAPRLQVRPGLLGWIGSCLTDRWSWQARLYLILKLPMGILSFTVAFACYLYGLGALTYVIWWRSLPCNTSDGVCHRGVGIANDYYIDSPFRIAWFAVAGALLLLAAPWVVKGVVRLDRLAVRALLVPNPSAERVEELEQSRAIAVEDAATTLRRIERDLHDGAQARLVALAMNVGLAKEKLAEGGDPVEAQRLLETAHVGAKDAIAELRDLARGIHPPVLDAGLDTALATLAANSAVPVALTTDIRERPSPAVETIAYFCAAELLTNVAKHSGARSAQLDARTVGGALRLAVSDDGSGGARIGAGTGLTGLAERVRTVDGTLDVSSPAGGPTGVTVELPLRGRR
jgi:signal transduction histidine kinase